MQHRTDTATTSVGSIFSTVDLLPFGGDSHTAEVVVCHTVVVVMPRYSAPSSRGIAGFAKNLILTTLEKIKTKTKNTLHGHDARSSNDIK